MKFLWIVQSSYKGDNSPPQPKGRDLPVLLAVAEEEYNNEPLRRKLIAYFSIK